MMQSTDVTKQIQQLSSEQLAQVISQCEQSIADESAVIEDYEKFIVCQQELARRTWSQA